MNHVQSVYITDIHLLARFIYYIYLHDVGSHVLCGFTLGVEVLVRLHGIDEVVDGRRDLTTQSISRLLRARREGRDAREIEI